MHLRQSQSGMTLAELLVGMMVAIVMLLMLAKLQVEAVDDMRAKQTAESMQSFTQMAAQYLVANRPAVQAAADAGTTPEQYCVLGASPTTGTGGTTANNTTLKTCAIDVAWLKWKKMVPMDFKETNSYGQKLVAIYRVVYADYDNNGGTADTTNGDIEMLVVGATNSGNERATTSKDLGLIADLMGGNGGIIPSGDWGACKYTGTDKQACGNGGGWRVDLTKFLN